MAQQTQHGTGRSLHRSRCIRSAVLAFLVLLLNQQTSAQPMDMGGPAMMMSPGSSNMPGNMQTGNTNGLTTLSPQTVDSSFYGLNPAPAPAQCPNGDSTATLSEELEQGPYYVNEDLFRSNITENEAGVPFEIRLTVLDTNCNPVANAFVDVWMCNATGIYSGYLSSQQDAGGSTSRKMLQTGTDNSTFLRGTTLTDSNGVAVFYSIFPGWYAGRAVHVHTMMHMPEDGFTADNKYEVYENSSHIMHIDRVFFEDSILDPIYQLSPYNRHTGTITSVEEDDAYEGDERTIFTLTYVDSSDVAAGLIGSAVSIVNRTAHYTSDSSDVGGGSMGMGAGNMPGSVAAGGPDLPQAAGRKLLL